MNDLYVSPRLTIPGSEFSITASRSSGPGGQNVNKVNSKVLLRWSPKDCAALNPGWKRRFLSHFATRINRDGELVLQSERYRDQPRNITDVRQKLVEMLLQCQAPPARRKKTKPSRASQRRRLEKKRHTSEKKANRRAPGKDD